MHWRSIEDEQKRHEEQSMDRLQQEHEDHWRRVEDEQRVEEEQQLQDLSQSHDQHWYRQKKREQAHSQPANVAAEKGGSAGLVHVFEPTPPRAAGGPWLPAAVEPCVEAMEVFITPAVGQPSFVRVSVQIQQPDEH